MSAKTHTCKQRSVTYRPCDGFVFMTFCRRKPPSIGINSFFKRESAHPIILSNFNTPTLKSKGQNFKIVALFTEISQTFCKQNDEKILSSVISALALFKTLPCHNRQDRQAKNQTLNPNRTVAPNSILRRTAAEETFCQPPYSYSDSACQAQSQDCFRFPRPKINFAPNTSAYIVSSGQAQAKQYPWK